jgi:hypothetical protein
MITAEPRHRNIRSSAIPSAKSGPTSAADDDPVAPPSLSQRLRAFARSCRLFRPLFDFILLVYCQTLVFQLVAILIRIVHVDHDIAMARFPAQSRGRARWLLTLLLLVFTNMNERQRGIGSSALHWVPNCRPIC